MWWNITSVRSGPMFRLLCAMTMSTNVICFSNQSPPLLSRIQCESQNGSTSRRSPRATISDGFQERDLSYENRDLCSGTSGTSSDDVAAYHRMKVPIRGELSGHAIFGVLLGQNLIEEYEVWKSREAEEENIVVSFVTFGNSLNGHNGVVHGGIVSLIFDDTCGFAYEALGVTHAVTANLSIDYRAPVPQNTKVRVAVQLGGREGRKLYWKAQMTSMDQRTLYAEATSLYVIPRSNP